jgi:hypothetical protein
MYVQVLRTHRLTLYVANKLAAGMLARIKFFVCINEVVNSFFFKKKYA